MYGDRERGAVNGLCERWVYTCVTPVLHLCYTCVTPVLTWDLGPLNRSHFNTSAPWFKPALGQPNHFH